MDYKRQVAEAMRAARANGWEDWGRGKARRVSEHPTPEKVRQDRQWPYPTSEATEILAFRFKGDGAPLVTYESSPCSWKCRTIKDIGYRKALALLAEPLSRSAVHRSR